MKIKKPKSKLVRVVIPDILRDLKEKTPMTYSSFINGVLNIAANRPELFKDVEEYIDKAHKEWMAERDEAFKDKQREKIIWNEWYKLKHYKRRKKLTARNRTEKKNSKRGKQRK